MALAVALWVGAVHAAEPDAGHPRVHLWDVPKAVGAMDVPSPVVAHGIPVSIHAVLSRERADVLELHFRREFEKAGLFVPPAHHLTPVTPALQLTGLDPDTFVAYTVYLEPAADGTTTVILTESRLAEARTPAENPSFAPRMPGAHRVLYSQTEGVELMSYAVDATSAQAELFHREALGKAGYQELSPGTFQRGVDLLKVSTRNTEEDGLSIIVLHRRQVDGTLPP